MDVVSMSLAVTNQGVNQLFSLTKIRFLYPAFRFSNIEEGIQQLDLEISGDTTDNQLILATPADVDNQLWMLFSNGDGSYHLSTVMFGRSKSLQVVREGQEYRLKMMNTRQIDSQKWRFFSTQEADSWNIGNLWIAGKLLDKLHVNGIVQLQLVDPR